MLRVGIIGCGKIADQHAEQISWLDECRLVGVCDLELMMAQQLAERFSVEGYYDDVDVFLNKVRPDVVHITTPAQSHLQLAERCIEAGCHIYVEKPFTRNVEEAEEILGRAMKKGINVTVGHNLQFSEPAIRMRKLVADGYLGGSPTHMESIFGYDLGDRSYAAALLGDKSHWVRGLPGGLAQNVISHGVCRIAEFLKCNNPNVISTSFSSPLLKSIGETDIRDEIRSIIRGDGGVTAYFTFTSQLRPVLHQFRVYGAKNSLILDDDHQLLIMMEGGRYKSYVEHFWPPFKLGMQYIRGGARNINHFLHRKYHTNSGMRNLIEAFYRSIRGEGPLPIPYSEIALTARIMDNIFLITD